MWRLFILKFLFMKLLKILDDFCIKVFILKYLIFL